MARARALARPFAPRLVRPTRSAAVLAFALVACNEAPPPEPEPEPEAPSTGAARWEPVRRPTDAALLEQPAHVIADPGSMGDVGAPFRARVVRVDVRVGQRVAAGDPIVEVVMPEVLDAAATMEGAETRIAAHRARAEELERLRAEGLVDAARVFEQQAIVAELEAARARALAVLRGASVPESRAPALLRRGTVVLASPTAGIVRSLDARPGETRDPGATPFARVVGEGSARVEVRSTEPLPPRADLTFDAAGTSVPLARDPIAHVVDPVDGTHVTWLAPAEPTVLPDGLRGRVRVRILAEDAWEVPETALVPSAEGAVIERRTERGVERVPVRVIATSGATAIVRGALREGDMIASDPSALAAEAK